MKDVTEIRIDENGDETHESWITMRANRVSGQGTLFDSDIVHQHYVIVTISRCKRRRNLNHDWIYNTQEIAEAAMSFAQWGAFVSSFGDGSGVPCTLNYLMGDLIPGAPHEPRMAESLREVRGAADKSIQTVKAASDAVEAGFEEKLGRREMAERIRNLHYAVINAPANMTFAAESLGKHAENVVTKAKGDIEAMVLSYAHQVGVDAGEMLAQPMLGAGATEPPS